LLHLLWAGASTIVANGECATPSIQGAAQRTSMAMRERMDAAGGERDEVEHRLEAAMSQLPAKDLMLVQKARATASPVPRAMPSGPVGRRASPPGPAIAGPAGLATRKLARDAAQVRVLCAANASGLPTAICKPNIRDHRTGPVRDHR
jgi:hypothetical protein